MDRDDSTPWGDRVWDGEKFTEFGGQGFSTVKAAFESYHKIPGRVRDRCSYAYVVGPRGHVYYIPSEVAP
jgi:hypothetical protein